MIKLSRLSPVAIGGKQYLVHVVCGHAGGTVWKVKRYDGGIGYEDTLIQGLGNVQAGLVIEAAIARDSWA